MIPPTQNPRFAVTCTLAAALLLPWAGVAIADEDPANAQLEFGIKMAQRGLWSEALFRFKQADVLRPGSARTLNNIAVAYEALGKFDLALDYYQRAVKSGGDADLRKNYSRFVEFYRNFKPEGDGTGEAEATAVTAEADSSTSS